MSKKALPSPAFVLDEKRLVKNLEIIENAQKSGGFTAILAFKAFSMWSTFPLIKEYVSGATASSLHEVRLCYEEMGVKAHTYCVAYDSDSFDEIVSKSSYLTFNSLSQYHQFIDRVPDEVKVGLRINPEWSDVETALYNPSDSKSRLGVVAEQLDDLPARISGLHFHVLCESDSFALQHVIDSVEQNFGKYLDQISWLNMGGGHLMTGDQYNLDHLCSVISTFKSRHNLTIILEPGSAFAWQVGTLETKILDIVENGGQKTIIFNGSFTCHMPDCLEMPYRPSVRNASAAKVKSWLPYRLGGVSCLAGDYLENYWFEKEPRIGDSLIFDDMIHYTMVKTNTFNGVQHPAIAIRRESGTVEIVKEFGYQDYKERLS